MMTAAMNETRSTITEILQMGRELIISGVTDVIDHAFSTRDHGRCMGAGYNSMMADSSRQNSARKKSKEFVAFKRCDHKGWIRARIRCRRYLDHSKSCRFEIGRPTQNEIRSGRSAAVLVVV